MTEKRFEGLTARQRYEKEYRENRIFNSHLNSNFDFGGDAARLNAYRSWQMRFSHVPNMPRFAVYRLFESVTNELLEKWPNACNIRYGNCHCDQDEMMLSFQLPLDRKLRHRLPGYQDCGFWCVGCNWSNAGARPVEEATYDSRD